MHLEPPAQSVQTGFDNGQEMILIGILVLSVLGVAFVAVFERTPIGQAARAAFVGWLIGSGSVATGMTCYMMIGLLSEANDKLAHSLVVLPIVISSVGGYALLISAVPIAVGFLLGYPVVRLVYLHIPQIGTLPFVLLVTAAAIVAVLLVSWRAWNADPAGSLPVYLVAGILYSGPTAIGIRRRWRRLEAQVS